jgi:hypothetical protein
LSDTFHLINWRDYRHEYAIDPPISQSFFGGSFAIAWVFFGGKLTQCLVELRQKMHVFLAGNSTDVGGSSHKSWRKFFALFLIKQ